MKDFCIIGGSVVASFAFLVLCAMWVTVFPTIGVLWSLGVLK